MKRLLLAGAALAALVSAAPADAQTGPTRYVFVAVDAVEVQHSSKLAVTGILDGENAARTVTVNLSTTSSTDQVASCERLALLALTRPGQFQLELQIYGSSFYGCKLTRVTL